MEPQSQKIPNDEELMAQKKHNHLQKQSDANFDEEKHLDVEKQHQALPIAPEG